LGRFSARENPTSVALSSTDNVGRCQVVLLRTTNGPAKARNAADKCHVVKVVQRIANDYEISADSAGFVMDMSHLWRRRGGILAGCSKDLFVLFSI
jgi:hypothetical protein